MILEPSNSQTERRGSVLILVVGVLVLLAIIASAYVRIGRLERVSASAQQTQSRSTEIIGSVFDYIGLILAKDLFANDNLARKPFGDGERWDYPFTRRGADFARLADPWLASSEPVDTNGDGIEDTWPHLSNIEQQGRFVNLGNLFSIRDFYTDELWISGTPRDLDSPLFRRRPDWPNFLVQIDDVNAESDGYVTMADRQFGEDTDGDGRVDARWTELRDVYGMPNGMRVFTAVRVVDNSARLNVNTHIELGLRNSASNTDAQAGTGRNPSDVDLYSVLWEEYARMRDHWDGYVATENEFLFDGQGLDRGFRSHLVKLGVADLIVDDGGLFNYRPNQRLTRDQRYAAYARFGSNGYGFPTDSRPYDASDEIELRRFWGTSNSRDFSTLEQVFGGLNFPNDDSDWNPQTQTGNLVHASPLRDTHPYEVNYNANTPFVRTDSRTFATGIMDDVRRHLTTYSGSRAVRPWNRGGDGRHGILNALNINDLLDLGDDDPDPDVQNVFSGLFWALAPYAINHDDNGNNVFGTPTIWKSGNTRVNYHYGDGAAGFAYLRAAMLALNLLDYADKDEDKGRPTVRHLAFDNGYTSGNLNFNDPNRWLTGTMDHGVLPPDGIYRNGADAEELTLIGLDAQPFLREVANVAVYYDSNIYDGILQIDPEDNENDIYLELVAFELGNPWGEPIDLDQFEIRLGTEDWSLAGLGLELDEGESIILYAASRPERDPVIEDWLDVLQQRMGNMRFERIDKVGGVVSPRRIFDNYDSAIRSWHEVSLWHREGMYGRDAQTQQQTYVDVMVDRINARANGSTNLSTNFPNLLTTSDTYGSGSDPEGMWYVYNASLRRFSDHPSTSPASFPGYVFQSPVDVDNNGTGVDEYEPNAGDSEVVGMDVPPADLIELADAAGDFDNYLNDSSEAKGYSGYDTTYLAAFEWHMEPEGLDGGYESPFQFMLVSPVSHMHIGLTSNYGSIQQMLDDSDAYITMSEYLGDPDLRTMLVGLGVTPELIDDVIRPAFEMPDFRLSPNFNPNPMAGQIDFTRFIPRDELGGGRPQPEFGLPLATRIVDAFETMAGSTNGRLVQGRINLNTAPDKVLGALPYISPRYDVEGMLANSDLLVRTIKAYRDQLGPDPSNDFDLDWSQRWEASNLRSTPGEMNATGIRDDDTRDAGFISRAELGLLTEWTFDSVSETYAPVQGDPTRTDESLLRLGQDGLPLDFEPLLMTTSEAATEFNLEDSTDEWLAIPDAVVNSVSTRSDVFVAYVSILGVTEADVRAAEALANRTGASNLEALRPTLDKRYMCVFDRSNVQSPTDQPKLLFAVQQVPRP